MTRYAANGVVEIVTALFGSLASQIHDLDGPVFQPVPTELCFFSFAWTSDPSIAALYGTELGVTPEWLLRNGPFEPMTVETVSSIAVPEGQALGLASGAFSYTHVDVDGTIEESFTGAFDPLATTTSTPLPPAANPLTGLYFVGLGIQVYWAPRDIGDTTSPMMTALARNNYTTDLLGGNQIPAAEVGAVVVPRFIARVKLGGEDTGGIQEPPGALITGAISIGTVRKKMQRIAGIV